MIKDLAELQKLLKLCRKHGITEIKLGDVAVKFGDLPQKSGEDAEDTPIDPNIDPLTGLTHEQLAFFSAPGGGVLEQ